MRRGLGVATAVVAMASVGCGGEGDEEDWAGLVAGGTPPATPYDGPLYVPGEEPEVYTLEAVRTAAGAAGRALECDGEIYSGGGSGSWGKSDGGRTPEEGLRAFFDMEQADDPRHGYRVEREEADRVLFSFDVDGRTKVAVVVAKDQKGRPGWGPESNATCDPAELPASFTESKPYEIWTDRNGDRVPLAEVSSHAGDAHCGWETARFLSMGHYEDDRTYARDPDGVLGSDLLTAPYDGEAALPEGARDTGFRFGDRQLWLTDDPSKVYVRASGGVEAWPLVKDGMGCR
ncbi:hypothetical protein [Streptomyces dysideae]|uniref:Lipoprotein n=1 Tax=Streptomyces dysideae TaxID=909626 RepID=A0A101UWM0_9ACTN|nr:hypothetical protein [Streptomyces dysideae]KUO18198.1 hypothetical protein AQJ91_25960 [Streptomyces dysideae]